PTMILSSIPSVTNCGHRRRCELPVGRDWRVERFSATTLRWSEAARADAMQVHRGLFRFRYRYQWLHFLCIRGIAYEVPGAIAKYLLLKWRRRRVVRFDPNSQTLELPASCRPPL